MEELIFEELKTELSVVDDAFNEDLLLSKVRNAIREVKLARNYPKEYPEDVIAEDLEKYHSDIRDIALYDYNQIGAEFQSEHKENETTRAWVSRKSLFNGVLPISRL